MFPLTSYVKDDGVLESVYLLIPKWSESNTYLILICSLEIFLNIWIQYLNLKYDL